MFLRYKKGFTLMELLIVIAIIGILSAVIIPRMTSARAKAKDAKRSANIDSIYKALLMYQDDHGNVPTSYSYGEANTGGWDQSAEGDFMPFLKEDGLMTIVPVDPINSGPVEPWIPEEEYWDQFSANHSYFYYCYPGQGVVLGFRREDGNLTMFKNSKLENTFQTGIYGENRDLYKDSNFSCNP